MNQTSTRGDGTVSLGENFNSIAINFDSARSHVGIHFGGDVAGSQFNGDLFPNSDVLITQITKLLPPELSYDQHHRAELTLEVEDLPGTPIGWSGVMAIDEIRKLFPNAKIVQEMRNPGGVEEAEGAWYPDGRYEPKANIAHVSKSEYRSKAVTNKLTIIIQKDPNGVPKVMTMFPGENAPAYPVRMNLENNKIDTTGNTPSTLFWNRHAFIKSDLE